MPPHWGVRITLAVAPTKNMDRMEWLLEKAVEIGVDRIVFLKCARSERKVVKLDLFGEGDGVGNEAESERCAAGIGGDV